MQPSFSRSPRREGGFTIAELLLALIVLALLAGIAAPAFNRATNQSRTRAALDRIAGDVAYTRTLAVREGRPTAMRFAGDGLTYTITVEAAAGSRTVKSVDLGADYTGIALVPPAAVIEFNSRGLIRTGSGFFTARQGSSEHKMTLTPIGQVYREY